MKSLLQKIKALILRRRRTQELMNQTQALVSAQPNLPKVQTDLEDWIKAIDELQPIVQTRRQDLEPTSKDRFNLELLGASTYLHHVDRLIVKIREHYLTYRYRKDQFSRQSDALTKPEFTQAYQACEQSYHTIVGITTMLQKASNKRLYSDEFITLIHALELETNEIGSSIRSLNQFAYRQEALMQIADLERTLERTLMESLTQTQVPTSGKTNNTSLGHYSPFYGTTDYLQSKIKQMPFPAHEQFLTRIVEVYDMLKKCYVVARKSVIKDTLDHMGDSIESLILNFYEKEAKSEDIFLHLHEIFADLESLRFSTNRESRCSRNLFEKAKIARRKLREACVSNALGQEFLKEIAVKRTSLIKEG